MKKFTSHIIAAAVFAVLALIGAIMNSRQAAAQGPSDGLAVRIAQPLPLPVSGSVGISGTVAATQTGPWNVGITGKASMRDMDNPARHAVHFAFSEAGTYMVPVGKILVIEDVSFRTPWNNGGAIGLLTSVNGVRATHWIAPVGFAPNGGAQQGAWIGGRTTRIYADPGTAVQTQSAGATLNSDVAFSGYLIDAN